MKKYILILITTLVLLSLLVPIWAVAHSGGTDSSGGHYDHSTGEYHYHHGYPAHQHTGGVCPYRNSGNDWMDESEKRYQESLEEDDEKNINWIAIIVGAVAISLVCTGVVLLNLGVIDKLSNVVSNILLGVWIVLLLAAIVCLINAPGAIILIGIFEGIGAGIIYTSIEERREKKKTEDSNEKTSRR